MLYAISASKDTKRPINFPFIKSLPKVLVNVLLNGTTPNTLGPSLALSVVTNKLISLKFTDLECVHGILLNDIVL